MIMQERIADFGLADGDSEPSSLAYGLGPGAGGGQRGNGAAADLSTHPVPLDQDHRDAEGGCGGRNREARSACADDAEVRRQRGRPVGGVLIAQAGALVPRGVDERASDTIMLPPGFRSDSNCC